MQNTSLIEKIQKLPAETIVEVEHFVEYLTEKQKARKERDRLLLEYVNKHAGTDADFDEELEAASVEHLLETTEYE